ncbi:hypothetical protein AB0I72_00405 [Nocardiopsis sp. NPDC049922]|uniref:hypothetical protein n=1 Tax=Nocardiopsis sp. NPDC049922 TaxID=3155157 RepID=UPI0033D17E9E
MAEHRLNIRIPMREEEEAAFRADHALGEHDSTRDRLATTIHDELEGLGAINGWWREVHVS